VERLQEALAALEGAPPRLERIRVLVELGAALRRAHQRSQAGVHLREALRLASEGGVHALAAQARAELAAAGLRGGAPTRAGAGTLTASELRVARLAAAGHSNREIAQMLFVTVKAVEYHLSNTYRKLGIRRRSQLAPLEPGAQAHGFEAPAERLAPIG
jgi:DNA-binding NarL/FixJ family response regulator